MRACVNPLHLEHVTKKENIMRGAWPCAINAKKTHCPRGHPYSAENTQHYKRWGRPKGSAWRLCRESNRLNARRYYWKRTHGIAPPEEVKSGYAAST